MTQLNSPEFQFRSWRTGGIERAQIESFCRQVLALCYHEYQEERQFLLLEKEAILLRRKREAVIASRIDEAPGVIVEQPATSRQQLYEFAVSESQSYRVLQLDAWRFVVTLDNTPLRESFQTYNEARAFIEDSLIGK